MKIAFASPGTPKSGILAVTVAADRALGTLGRELDQKTGGLLTRAMEQGRFTGKAEEVLNLVAPAGLDVARLLLVGVGAADGFDGNGANNAGAAAYAAVQNAGEADLAVALDTHEGVKGDAGELAAEVAFGALLRSYRFDKYRTTLTDDRKPSVKKVTVQTDATKAAKKAWDKLEKVAEGIFVTRDVVSEPPNTIYPETLADRCVELSKLGLEVEVLDEKKMKKLGMGALLGVGQGSVRPPRLVVMKWNGGAKDDAPVAFVGKGITFDTGGISIKPAANMDDMKWDMGGSGTVIGLMAVLAGRKAKVNAVGVVALAENMPDGNAQRPGDVVSTMSGQTIEVLNTDAEGRLVLADALWYTQDQFKPQFMVDLATLTGAIIVSLGNEHAGLFSNDDDLAAKLTDAGLKTGEKLWRLPLSPAYDKDIDSDVADVKNIGRPMNAGSIIGAQFLQRFVNKVPWAHLDIAGTAWNRADKGMVPKGATAFGVRLLDKLVATHYEG